MKLIESSVEYLPQEEGLEGVYKQIERCARTCYKSEDRITEDSAKGFVDRMIKSHHSAMLEHGTVYFYIKSVGLDKLPGISGNPYSKVKIVKSDTEIGYNEQPVYYIYATTNLRVLEEEDAMHYIQYIQEPSSDYEKRYTFRFTTSIGIVRELIRHRTFSFANESTRYCNYTKDKFENQITFIKPWWLDKKRDLEFSVYDDSLQLLINTLEDAEHFYNLAVEGGLHPQDAREFLPLATKSELIMTGFASDYRHLLDLRLFGKTGQPHPDMVDLMEKLRYEALEAGIWNDIMKYPSKFE